MIIHVVNHVQKSCCVFDLPFFGQSFDASSDARMAEIHRRNPGVDLQLLRVGLLGKELTSMNHLHH